MWAEFGGGPDFEDEDAAEQVMQNLQDSLMKDQEDREPFYQAGQGRYPVVCL